jgi:hypothetical protein
VTLFVRRIRDWKRLWVRPLLHIFEIEVLGYAVEVKRRIADIGFRDFLYTTADPVHDLIGEVFGDSASAPHEDLDQLLADLFVLLASAFAIRVKPSEESVKSILIKIPLTSHRKPHSYFDFKRVSITQW